MNSLKIMIFSLSLLSVESSYSHSGYFFKQVGLSAAVGAASGLAFKDDANVGTGAIVVYVALKFFHDVLSANNGTEIVKGFMSVPLNAGVAAAAALITLSVAK